MLHKIELTQQLPVKPESAWDFISSPANLQLITPDYMSFKILSPFDKEEKIYAGMIIEYTVKPLFRIPMHWVTEITHVDRLHYFVDEQRKGPYKFWHHKHFIREIPGGVEIRDVVHYELPLYFLGSLIHIIIIKHQLKNIFEYRRLRMEQLFGIYIPL